MTLLDPHALLPLQHAPSDQASVRAPAALERSFPTVDFSRIGQHESWRKEIHRPATSVHKWWAKRLGSIFRGILVSATSGSEAEASSAYGSPSRLTGLVVFDPFSGSGTTVVEAIKLGACAVGYDINPVATLVQRQAVQCWNETELRRGLQLLEKACRPEVDRVHQAASGEPTLYYFWVAFATCTTCQVKTRLFSTHVFAQHAYPSRVPNAQVVCPECLDLTTARFDFHRHTCRSGHSFLRAGAVDGRIMTCPNGHASNIVEALAGERPKYEMYAKLVLGFDGRKRYEPIDEFDLALYQECSQLLADHERDLVLPRGELAEGYNTRQALRWGFSTWRDFFNDRQLYSLGLMASAIRDLDVGGAEKEALTALFSGTLEFNNMFCSFKGEGTGAVRHMFSHHVLKPERTPLEAHPWGTPASSGAFSTLFEGRLIRANAYKANPTDHIERGGRIVRVSGLSLPIEARIVGAWPSEGLTPGTVYLRTGDASQTDLPDTSVDLIVTDPPYMDNVHYSELADFFHAWLSELRPYPGYPADASTTRRVGEVQSGSPEEFREAITRVWKECSRVLKHDGLVAFTFHQSRLDAWAALMESLAKADLMVTAIQPVKGEMSTSVTKNGSEPSNLDSVVVCRKRCQAQRSLLGDPLAAAARATSVLTDLRAAGVDVGPGDVRSAVRGYVLATFTVEPREDGMRALIPLADELATRAVSEVTARTM